MSSPFYLSGIRLSRDPEGSARAVATQQLLTAKIPDADVRFISFRPKEDRGPAKEWGVSLVAAGRGTLVLWTLRTGAFHLLDTLGFPARWCLPKALKHLAQARALVQLRGLGDTRDPLRWETVLFLSLARSLGKTPVVLSQDSPQRGRASTLTRWLLKAATVVVARGTQSLKDLDAFLPGKFIPRRQDVALCLHPGSRLAHRILPDRFFKEGYYCVAPSADLGTPLAVELRERVRQWVLEEQRNVCLVACTGQDGPLCRAILDELPSQDRIRLLSHPVHPSAMKGTIAGARWVLTGRTVVWLHALSSAVPSLILHPHPWIENQLREWEVPQWGWKGSPSLAAAAEIMDRQLPEKRRWLENHLPLLIQSAENNIEWALEDVAPQFRRAPIHSALAWEEA